MTEAALLRDVTAVAGELGLLWHHCPRAHLCSGPRGFLDLLIAGPGGLVLAELKSADGETSAGQDLWIWTLERGGQVTVCVWRRADLVSGRIRRQLEAVARPRPI